MRAAFGNRGMPAPARAQGELDRVDHVHVHELAKQVAAAEDPDVAAWLLLQFGDTAAGYSAVILTFG